MVENNLSLKLNTKQRLDVGIDLGSTTAKLVVVRDGEVIYSCYERHFAQVRAKVLELLHRIRGLFGTEADIHCAVSGSAGLGMAKAAGLPFVQEVFATGEVVRALEPSVISPSGVSVTAPTDSMLSVSVSDWAPVREAARGSL